MRFPLGFLLILVNLCVGQTIWDIWQTDWNRNHLFSRLASNSISFTTPGAIGDANIVIDPNTQYQSMDGFGATLTDSSALILSNLKASNSSGYWSLLSKLFDPTEGASSAALSVIRVPLGASDLSASAYTFDDTWNDSSLGSFTLNSAPSYLWSTLADIKSVTQYLKIIVVPWSAPAWMKTSSSLYGGSLTSGYESIFAQYLFKSVQAMNNKGLRPYAISCQNEPQNSDSTYPTMLLSVSQEASVGKTLRSLLDSNGFSDVKLIGYDHNWDNAGTYPVQLMQQASSAFSGVAFHCYAGEVSGQATFTRAYPNKEVYFTECTGTVGSDWWSNIKWNMYHLFVGSTSYSARTVLLWNLAAHADGSPRLPGTDSCASGCRPVVSVDNNAWYLNEEYYLLAHSSRIVIPRDSGGPFGTRIGVTVEGTLSWTLSVQAYMTRRSSSSDQVKYGLVVINWYDNASSSWNPQPVSATIAFRGLQARYTFPVGLTTLWFYASEYGLNEEKLVVQEEVKAPSYPPRIRDAQCIMNKQ